MYSKCLVQSCCVFFSQPFRVSLSELTRINMLLIQSGSRRNLAPYSLVAPCGLQHSVPCLALNSASLTVRNLKTALWPAIPVSKWMTASQHCAKLRYLQVLSAKLGDVALLRGTDRKRFPHQSPGHHNCQVNISYRASAGPHAFIMSKGGHGSSNPCISVLIRRRKLFICLQSENKAVSLDCPTAIQPVPGAGNF